MMLCSNSANCDAEGSSPWIHDLRGVLMEYNHRIDNAAANGDFILL